MTCERIIVLLADGARDDVTRELLNAGKLPNISRHILTGGSHLSAVTSFPSTTGPAHMPFLTGALPGTLNVPGIRWFDKALFGAGHSFDRYRSYVGFESFMMASDMRKPFQTMFEIVPRSYSIFNSIARGAGRRNLTTMSRIWYWYYGHLTDHWDFVDEAAMTKVISTLDHDPRFVFAVFPAIDEFAHFGHTHHPRCLAQYARFDESVGQLVDNLKSRGMWETTAIFIVSDHGLSATHTHFCVNTFLEEHKLPAFFYPLIYAKRGKLSANMVSGNSMTHVYFKNHDGWTRRTVVEELDRIAPGLLSDLLTREAVDILAMRTADGDIAIESRRGRAHVRLDGETLRYRTEGSDPFGYAELPASLSPEECLRRTFDSDYPDAPFQLAHLMSAPRSGDLVISATPGFDLRDRYEHPEHRGSHGSLHWTHMRVPILTNVPIATRPVRTVDVFPTVLKLLGHEVPEHIDGQALI